MFEEWDDVVPVEILDELPTYNDVYEAINYLKDGGFYCEEYYE